MVYIFSLLVMTIYHNIDKILIKKKIHISNFHGFSIVSPECVKKEEAIFHKYLLDLMQIKNQ
jgi:hypothetical protein